MPISNDIIKNNVYVIFPIPAIGMSHIVFGTMDIMQTQSQSFNMR